MNRLNNADKWFASSKTCNVCGYVKKDLELKDREWTCPSCGVHHHRDTNAGINLKNYGVEILTAGTAGFAVPDKSGAESQGSLVLG